MEIFQINYDPVVKKYFIAPMSAQISEKYLIQFDTKAEAVLAISDLQIENPLTVPNKFKKLYSYANGKTVVYKKL